MSEAETAAKWTERVRSWRASGASAASFAAGQGFAASTLRWWERKVMFGWAWIKECRDEKDSKLSDLIDEIVREVAAAASVIADLVVEAERKAEIARSEAEIQHEKWKREEAERQRLQMLQQIREQSHSIIDTWGGVHRIEGSFADAERRVAALPDAEAAPVRERLVRARELIAEADALRGLREWRTPEKKPRPDPCGRLNLRADAVKSGRHRLLGFCKTDRKLIDFKCLRSPGILQGKRGCSGIAQPAIKEL